MKNFILINPYIPLKCCGADPVSAAVFGGLNLVGSAFDSFSQDSINDKNLQNQRKENAINRQFNHDEADLQRKWQSAEWKRQFNMQSDEWDRQQREMQRLARENFLFEADYNSPTNQIARMQEAGINPAASGGAQGLLSAASGNLQNQGSVSVPSGGTVSGSSASFSGGQLPAMQKTFNVSEIGSFLKDLSDVYISNSKLRPEIDNLTYDLYNKYLDSQGKQILNGINGIDLQIRSVTKNASIGKAFQEWRNAITQEYLNMALKGEADSRTSLNAAENLLKEAELKIKGKEYEQLVFAVTNQQKAFDNMLMNDRAKRASDYASAAHSNAMATTEEQLRTFKVNNEQLLRDIHRLDWRQEYNKTNISNATVSSEQVALIKEFTEKAAREEIITASMVVQLQDAIQRKDWYLVDQVLTHAENLINSTAKVSDSMNRQPFRRR